MSINRWMSRASVFVGLLTFVSPGGLTAQSRSDRAADSVTFVNEFPLALVYEGVARFTTGDFQGAIDVWEGYLARRERGADTMSVREMIHEAFVRQNPMALVYEGLSRHEAGDMTGAIGAWERFIELAPPGSDTVSVRELTRDVFVREYPMALLYWGTQLYVARNFEGAIAAWERYLPRASSATERGDVQALIARAKAEQETNLAGNVMKVIYRKKG